MAATKAQIQELANAIAAQAQAIADDAIPEGMLFAQVQRLASNVGTLKAWAPDDRNTDTAPTTGKDCASCSSAYGKPCLGWPLCKAGKAVISNHEEQREPSADQAEPAS